MGAFAGYNSMVILPNSVLIKQVIFFCALAKEHTSMNKKRKITFFWYLKIVLLN